mmetsp:Transcript_12091/g.32009  ORF Transcript_12091/g.32009 Transcript_12091/m.32009 type:complete len:87 (-) Transcript_12091:348-608(-)
MDQTFRKRWSAKIIDKDLGTQLFETTVQPNSCNVWILIHSTVRETSQEGKIRNKWSSFFQYDVGAENRDVTGTKIAIQAATYPRKP